MAVVRRHFVLIRFVIMLPLLHDVDLSVQTLVVNLGDMFLLRLLDDPSDVVHVSGFRLLLDLLDDGWVLRDNVVVQILLREGHGFYWISSDVNVLRFGVVEHVVVTDVVERKCFFPNFGGHGDVVLLGI